MALMTLFAVTILASLCAGQHHREARKYDGFGPLDYPVGDPRRCLPVNTTMQVFEVLPGFGWDNLRNVVENQVVTLNYSTCRVTKDGYFLLPDSVTAFPVKTSSVQTSSELFTHWKDWTSSNSKTINAEAGVEYSFVSVSGSFSYDSQDVKAKQMRENTVTTRTALRYVRYKVQLQLDAPLHPAFRARVLVVAKALEDGHRDEASFQAQLLVRDFGTHVVTKAVAGATLEKVDHLRQDWAMSQSNQKQDIRAAASASFFSVFKVSASYEQKKDESIKQSYASACTDSSIQTKGGIDFQPENFTLDAWSRSLDDNLVFLDRDGYPLNHVITAGSLPELKASTVNKLRKQVKEAVEAYYSNNTIKGCLSQGSPNFSPGANVDDGTCTTPYSFTASHLNYYGFGGMYQTCSSNGGGCEAQVNFLTGDYSCPRKTYENELYTDSTGIEIRWCSSLEDPSDVDMSAWKSGYLFGGLFSEQMVNPVTHAKSCPPFFVKLEIGETRDNIVTVCVSDDFEFGQKYSLPFAGFLSCQQRHRDANASWPTICPDGYSKHLAMVIKGCEINYCVMTGAMPVPVLTNIRRPPFMEAPNEQLEEDQLLRDDGRDACARPYQNIESLFMEASNEPETEGQDGLDGLKIKFNDATARHAAELEALKNQHAAEKIDIETRLGRLEDEVRRLRESDYKRVHTSQAFLATGLSNTEPDDGDILKFENVLHGSGYNKDNGAFVAAYTGTYLVTCTARVTERNSGQGYVRIDLYRANVWYLYSAATVDSSNDLDSVTLTAVVALQKGQTLDVRAGQGSMKIFGWSTHTPIFAVALLHSEE